MKETSRSKFIAIDPKMRAISIWKYNASAPNARCNVKEIYDLFLLELMMSPFEENIF